MFQNFSSEFIKYKDPTFVNLNNGTLGLCPDSVIDQQIQELKDFEKNTSYALGSTWNRLWNIQAHLGSFLNADGKDIFLRPNVTLALNELLMGLNLAPKSEILTTNFEYGAVVNILKYKCAKDGLTLRQENFDFLYESITDEEFVERLLGYTNSNTSVVAISHIFTGNGICIPLGKLATALKAKNILLVVDGAHAPGRVNLDFKNDLHDVDYYCGNLHKWFMGPKGTAFGWVHPKHQEHTHPLYGSWTTDHNTPWTMQDFKITPFAERMLWSHSQNFAAYYGLESTFDFWDQHGKDQIFAQIDQRMIFLQEQLKKIGIHPVKSMNTACGSVLIGYELSKFPKISLDGLFALSSHGKVQVGLPNLPGKQLIRLTPHIHNSIDEIDFALKVLIEAAV